MVYSEHTPVELKRHKKQENDQWRILPVQADCTSILKGLNMPNVIDVEVNVKDVEENVKVKRLKFKLPKIQLYIKM